MEQPLNLRFRYRKISLFFSNDKGVAEMNRLKAQPSCTVAHKCNGETKRHGETNFNSRHNKINLQSNETSRQNKQTHGRTI